MKNLFATLQSAVTHSHSIQRMRFRAISITIRLNQTKEKTKTLDQRDHSITMIKPAYPQKIQC